MTVVYSSEHEAVRVNDENWKGVKVGSNSFAQKQRQEETFRYLLTVQFSQRKGRAAGRLVYMRFGSDEKPTCVDALKLSGSYSRN